ncbi:LuxR C-terminal-related transcriptional regulator [Flexithrix dorotheae]|uniref:LuxR C-terminal-related transcriptional regulator n=1 Tax=Flexithrix dorotheae TaxID=70993 RepID=UPI00037D9E32|nr:LuxR C-terminal-related transcriptional regulator [Flexithrix dorotheae]
MTQNIPQKSLSEFLNDWKNKSYDADVGEMKKCLNPNKYLDFITPIGNYFIFIMDYQLGKYAFMSPSVHDILGYKINDFKRMGPSLTQSILHPEDIPHLNKVLGQIDKIFSEVPLSQKMEVKVNYNYRIKHKQGNYVHILQQNIPIQIDSKGNIVYSLGICNDITSFSKDTTVLMDVEFPSEKNRLIPIIFTEGKKMERFTKREIQLIPFLNKGLSSKEIGDILCISEHTVNKHRKNMMKKANVKNTLGLLNFLKIRNMV